MTFWDDRSRAKTQQHRHGANVGQLAMCGSRGVGRGAKVSFRLLLGRPSLERGYKLSSGTRSGRSAVAWLWSGEVWKEARLCTPISDVVRFWRVLCARPGSRGDWVRRQAVSGPGRQQDFAGAGCVKSLKKKLEQGPMGSGLRTLQKKEWRAARREERQRAARERQIGFGVECEAWKSRMAENVCTNECQTGDEGQVCM